MRRMVTGKQVETVEKLDKNIKFNEDDITITVPYESEGSEVYFTFGDPESESYPGIYLKDGGPGYGLSLGVYSDEGYNSLYRLIGDQHWNTFTTPAKDDNYFGVGYYPDDNRYGISTGDVGTVYGLQISNGNDINIFGSTIGLQLTTTTSGVYLTDSNNKFQLNIEPNQNTQLIMILKNLPTSDPHVVNALWNDSGVLKISSGS